MADSRTHAFDFTCPKVENFPLNVAHRVCDID